MNPPCFAEQNKKRRSPIRRTPRYVCVVRRVSSDKHTFTEEYVPPKDTAYTALPVLE